MAYLCAKFAGCLLLSKNLFLLKNHGLVFVFLYYSSYQVEGSIMSHICLLLLCCGKGKLNGWKKNISVNKTKKILME